MPHGIECHPNNGLPMPIPHSSGDVWRKKLTVSVFKLRIRKMNGSEFLPHKNWNRIVRLIVSDIRKEKRVAGDSPVVIRHEREHETQHSSNHRNCSPRPPARKARPPAK